MKLRRFLSLALAGALSVLLVGIPRHVLANSLPFYYLPWLSDATHTVSQGNGGSFSHQVGTVAQYAWDFADDGFTIHAARAGQVVYLQDAYGTGGCDQRYWNAANYVVVRTMESDGVTIHDALYLHVAQGSISSRITLYQSIALGTPIAVSDSSGWVCGAHLHFMVMQPGNPSGCTWWCQSIASSFLDANVLSQDGDGVPRVGQTVTSANPGARPARADTSTYSTGDYFLDGYGGIHPINGAPALSGGGSWTWDIARDFKLCPTDDSKGYLLDGWGGIHAVGNAVSMDGGQYGYNPGTDIYRAIAILPDCQTGYTLDGYGGIHPFAPNGVALPPAAFNYPYWSGQDIARGYVLWYGSGHSQASGYILDAYGPVHEVDNAPHQTNYPQFGSRVARGLVMTASNPCCAGYEVDGYGGLHPWGDPNSAMSPTPSSFSWSGDIARGISVRGTYLNSRQPWAPYLPWACGYVVEIDNSMNRWSENGAGC